MKKLILLIPLLFPFVVTAQYTTTPNTGMKLPNTGLSTGWDAYLNGNFSELDGLVGGVTTLTQNSTTPSVSLVTNVATNNTSATAITNFTSGYSGQLIRVLCGDTNTSWATGSTLYIVGGSFTCATNAVIQFVLQGTVWKEIGRNSGVSSSLTNNAIPKANGAASLVNSSMTDNGSTVVTSESFSTGSGAAGCPVTGCTAMSEAGVSGTPTATTDYIRADGNTHQALLSLNGGAEHFVGDTPLAYRFGGAVRDHSGPGTQSWGAFVWQVGVCTTAGDVAPTTTAPPLYTCTTGTTANTAQSAGFSGGDLVLGTNIRQITRGKTSATTATRVWWNCLTTGAVATIAASDTPAVSLACIRASSTASDVNYKLVTCNGSACNVVDTGVAWDTNLHRYEIAMNDAGSIATGCVDGTCVTSNTDYPATGVATNSSNAFIFDNTTTTSEVISWGQTQAITTQ